MFGREEINVIRAIAALEKACSQREMADLGGSGVTSSWGAFGSSMDGRAVAQPGSEENKEEANEPPTLREISFCMVDAQERVEGMEKKVDAEGKERMAGYRVSQVKWRGRSVLDGVLRG